MSLAFLCGLFSYTRQAYYKQLRRNAEGTLSVNILWIPRWLLSEANASDRRSQTMAFIAAGRFPGQPGSVVCAAFGKRSSDQTSEKVYRHDLFSTLDA